MIDIHCHAEHGQQDALAVAKLASENGMYGILYKSIGKEDKRSAGPMEDVRSLLGELERWSNETGIAPIKAWGGYALCRDGKAANRGKKSNNAGQGPACRRFWLALANHANTFFIVGRQGEAFGTRPPIRRHIRIRFPWEQALTIRTFCSRRKGSPQARIRRSDPDHCGQWPRPFVWALHLSGRFSRSPNLSTNSTSSALFIDHPFSPFVNLTVEQMKDLSKVGIHFNLHIRRALPPCSAVDPGKMYAAIRSVGCRAFYAVE